jgi:hypothetical protein
LEGSDRGLTEALPLDLLGEAEKNYEKYNL